MRDSEVVHLRVGPECRSLSRVSRKGLQEIVWVTLNRIRALKAALAGLHAAFQRPFRLSGQEAPPADAPSAQPSA